MTKKNNAQEATFTKLPPILVGVAFSFLLFSLSTLLLQQIIETDLDDESSVMSVTNSLLHFGQHKKGKGGLDDEDKSRRGGGLKKKKRNRIKNYEKEEKITSEASALGDRKEEKEKEDTLIQQEKERNYKDIRSEFDRTHPPDDIERLIQTAHRIRSSRSITYTPITSKYGNTTLGIPYDPLNCPATPPPNYPHAFPVMDVLNHWNPDDTDPSIKDRTIHMGLCRFDYATQREMAETYRKLEKPFVLRDDPLILRTVERWNEEGYLKDILTREADDEDGNNNGVPLFRTEYSKTNQLMFHRAASKKRIPQNWTQPTEMLRMSFEDWWEKAQNPNVTELGPTFPHWYFRVNAMKRAHLWDNNPKFDVNDKNYILYEELPFFDFDIENNFYMVNPKEQRGINCRFGMRGNIAENHFDGSRNFVVILGGDRRYLLSHPSQCPNLVLYPKSHPSGRHSMIDWSHPDLDKYPTFQNAFINEVVMQAGDALYLPTNWFHHIVSLNTNYQCNARSGRTLHYDTEIRKCGF